MQSHLFGTPDPYTVSDLTRTIRELLEMDYRLQDVWVQGEVGNISKPASGHLYFSLKDSTAQIRCVMWRNAVEALDEVPQTGDVVRAHGRIGVYEVQGAYQLYVDAMQAAGEVGDLYREFERLKARLQTEGLFDSERKRDLPRFPQRVGIVTSPSGAAIRDVLNVIERRWPLLDVIIAPTLVQGLEAPPQIVAALESLYARDDLDAIILARGGGSIEDLWAFNDERVAYAIYASPVPLICGVGHETDFTIADFVADVRAPTPSAAAELITPNRDDFLLTVDAYAQNLYDAMSYRLEQAQVALEFSAGALQRLSPRLYVSNVYDQLKGLQADMQLAMTHRLELLRERVEGNAARLKALSPTAVLERGYAVVRKKATDEVVYKMKQVKKGDRLAVRVSDGEFEVESK